MKRICSVCARGGSKGLPNKNILPLMGKPLIVHTIEHAQQAGIFDAIAVSSDSDAILDVAEKAGVKFLIKRPDELANDKAPKIPAIRHCAQETERLSGITFDTFTDMDCTSPLRSLQDVRDAVTQLETEKYGNTFSVTPARRSPYFDMVRMKDGKIRPCCDDLGEFTRRQDVPEAYDLNASIYVWDRQTLMSSDSVYNERTGLFVMPNERSIEIDSELEFIYTELLMKRYAHAA